MSDVFHENLKAARLKKGLRILDKITFDHDRNFSIYFL